MQKKTKKRIHPLKIGPQTAKAVEKLLKERNTRERTAKKRAGITSAVIGTVIFAGSAIKNPSFAKGVALLAPIVIGVTGATAVARHSKKIEKATELVGKGLVEEAGKNKEIMNLLSTHKYVIVDEIGNLKFTNLRRLPPFGRIRLNCIDLFFQSMELGSPKRK